MKHVAHAQIAVPNLPDSFLVRATGRYYTHRAVADHLIRALTAQLRMSARAGQDVRVCDPFGGDGRLIEWLMQHWSDAKLPPVRWRATLWDLDQRGLDDAKAVIRAWELKTGPSVELNCVVGDAFRLAPEHAASFDVVITNPPWELLKPDIRELQRLPEGVRDGYVSAMRAYDDALRVALPDAQPSRRFAGWGTNLSRVGLDLCRSICKSDGFVAAVMPASFLADDQSVVLRKSFLTRHSLVDAAYFPAECRLFGRADVSATTLLFRMGKSKVVQPRLTTYNSELRVENAESIRFESALLEKSGYVLPVSFGARAMQVLERLASRFGTWQDLEGDHPTSLWAGRELDETGSSKWLTAGTQGPQFIKGRMIDRFSIRHPATHRVNKPGWRAPASVGFERIAWRDVSRPSQGRRLIASLIPPGLAAGNSLGVAHFRDGSRGPLLALLGVMNSVCFELQLRSHLATGHVSLSSLRKVRLPDRRTLEAARPLATAVERALAGDVEALPEVEAIVARGIYGLSKSELELALGLFPKVSSSEKAAVLVAFENASRAQAHQREGGVSTSSPALSGCSPESPTPRIPNHFSARLSELDMSFVRAVPPGGNWKDIPESIPSKRLAQIRVSFKAGEGSRSTYYGRLRPDRPAYTINTYFSRPGNGCHVHYSQDRVLSQREAARLQSFPDSFAFLGKQGDVNTQIGNAVPPLLAYQIAVCLGRPGRFVDLFSGAGGLGLGLKWAGWSPIVANDIEPRFLDTYARNVHNKVVLGSIADPRVFAQLVSIAKDAKKLGRKEPFWIVGGPPCQGFSTAGNRRTMEDSRNHLVEDYIKFLREVDPDGFVFENVTGLLSMEGGRVFQQVRDAFRRIMPSVGAWVLSADEHAIPQRRKRVILVGVKEASRRVEAPRRLTSCGESASLFELLQPAITVEDALADLPALTPGQDGSHLDYVSSPKTPIQAFLRGELTAEEYLAKFENGSRSLRGRGSAKRGAVTSCTKTQIASKSNGART